MSKKRFAFIGIFILSIVLLAFLLRGALMEIISLLLISAVQAYLFLPMVKALEKRVNTTVAILLSFALTLVINVAVIMLLLPIFIDQIKNFSQSVPGFIAYVTDLAAVYAKKVPFLTELIGKIDVKNTALNGISSFLTGFSPAKIFSFVSTSLLIPVVMFYLLRDREQIKKLTLFLMPQKIRIPVLYAFRDINRQMRDYVFGEFVVILTVSALMGAALGVCGFDYWLILGLFMGIFNIIPYIGPVLGSIPILLVALGQGWNKIILGLVLILVVQQIDNLIIQPRIISTSVRIHPIIVLLCVVAGSSVGNLIGMVLAIPVYIILRILFREIYRYFTERKRNFPEIAKI
ncbi:MAG: AI-2E family transporter [Clostridia bacterium]|nr:AI-2E family transporter [Clostridia bacterium]